MDADVSSSAEFNNVGAGSPAMSSGASSGGHAGYNNKAGWKQCSGSLDSVLSKEEAVVAAAAAAASKASPGRRSQMLPRFSSFVQKRTNRMGLMIRRSPRHSTPPDQKNVERKCS
jgi:hypothetical protein